MKTILIFEPVVRGHIVEYLHHEYIKAAECVDYKLFLIVPEEFKKRSQSLSWPITSNIDIIYLSESEVNQCTQGNRMKRVFKLSLIIRKYVKRFSANYVFLNFFVNSMPILPFLLPNYCKVIGIVYAIYLWDKAKLHPLKLLANRMLYCFYSNCNTIKSVLLLNDTESVKSFNRYYSTNKFKYLPDPAQDIDNSKLRNIRPDLGIKQDDIVYFQLVIQKRKHIFDILDAIELCSAEELKKRVFIFAGAITGGIEKEFYNRISALKQRARIIDKSGYIPYDELYNLFYISDFCFALYDNSNSSSGVVNNSARLDTAVITSKEGLLGHIVSSNNLGICIEKIDPPHIKKSLFEECHITPERYNLTHRVSDFGSVIFEQFK